VAVTAGPMEESISGFKIRGDWAAVVEHGERITRALREAGLGSGDRDEDEVVAQADVPEAPIDVGQYEGAFAEWDEWRPKTHERLDEDVNEKTADQASVEEGAGEAAGKAPSDDVQTAGEKLADSYESVEEGDDEAAIEDWQDSVRHVARAADSAGRKALRAVENSVYKRVMTQLAPYYFDNELVSANVQRTAGEDDSFIFEVNVNDDALKAFVSERLDEYDERVSRWRIDTEKDTDTAAAAEGVEPPEEQGEGKSKSTTN
jgi:hypothetical protein